MRYLPHTPKDIEDMLRLIGVPDIQSLFKSIPDSSKLNRPLQLPESLSELELRNLLRTISRKNAHGEDWAVFLGGGSYSHYIPSVVSSLISRGEFLTAYTPYQPEVSQGTLQAIFEYQTMVSEILGLEISNASHYDGSTATAEAVCMALDLTKRKKVLVASNLHPEYRETIKTYLRFREETDQRQRRVEGEASAALPMEGATRAPIIIEIPFTAEGTLNQERLKALLTSEVACLVAATPNFFGLVEDLTDVADAVHQVGGLLITSTTEPLAFGLFKSPGEMGADIAVAEGQSFGNSMSFGGPTLGMFATKKEFVRAIPGRLVGETVDQNGQRGFVLTLATREQHIRREKASSNICTNVALCALSATITLALWGKIGFQELAQANFDQAMDLRERLASIPGVVLPFAGTSFNEFVIRTKKDPKKLIASLLAEQIIPGTALNHWYPELEGSLLVCMTEMNTSEQVDKLIGGLKKVL